MTALLRRGERNAGATTKQGKQEPRNNRYRAEEGRGLSVSRRAQTGRGKHNQNRVRAVTAPAPRHSSCNAGHFIPVTPHSAARHTPGHWEHSNPRRTLPRCIAAKGHPRLLPSTVPRPPPTYLHQRTPAPAVEPVPPSNLFQKREPVFPQGGHDHPADLPDPRAAHHVCNGGHVAVLEGVPQDPLPLASGSVSDECPTVGDGCAQWLLHQHVGGGGERGQSGRHYCRVSVVWGGHDEDVKEGGVRSSVQRRGRGESGRRGGGAAGGAASPLGAVAAAAATAA